MNFLVIQHLDIEPPGLIGELLQKAGHSIQTVHINRGEELPADSAHMDGIVIMGGPQSANDSHLCYIRDELQWLAARIDEGLPMIGICLGAQLMAKASGAHILRSPVRELGWFPVYRTMATATDPLFSAMTDGQVVFQWHGETFSISDSMTLLATHPDVPAQAFRLGQAQYGLQFHIEIDAAVIEQWIDYGESERNHLGQAGILNMRMAIDELMPTAHRFCTTLVNSWLEQIHPSTERA
ncbi:type 1 glutamine amidotransferase [Mariprofundus erugo]|uniref:Type 1 glutamine amidotransferase n=1 Tax=Mariprofundus erugo TaxID=2528639 RepID=A0A5R9GKF2_9PROT|nr:type 1 glutamine amidotransferase [Mariprofundus erugo]TLS65675.1 type 1 glutamine amidotransferase [Mariprofundus erugo]